ncbi:MAG: redoxin domain-containing protein [Pseudomonadota bacterium]
MKIYLALALLAAIIVWVIMARRQSRANNQAIALGHTLPSFSCVLEDGSEVSSDSLRGGKSVLLFVRGSWCPFCSEQVQSLTDHYRKITEEGGRLIIVTRRPLDTTKRVAEQFAVKFEFWLDSDLSAAQTLNLIDGEEIPDRFHEDFGRRTILPTVLVTDRDNAIRYSYRSAKPSDRPDPSKFMSVFESIA